MVRTQVRLTDEQADALKQASDRQQVAVAELIRQAIDYWLQSQKPSRAVEQTIKPRVLTEEQKQRAIAAARGFPSGVTDLAEKHDDYLVEAYGDFKV
jgi:hypothetical protein